MGADQHHRAVAARRRHRLRRRDALQARRLRALPLQDDRLRPDLDEDHQRHPRRRLHARRSARTRAGAGLLYAGTETGIYVSFDDGAHWQRAAAATCRSCRSTTWSSRTTTWSSATHGRSFWILDDLTPLRQLAAAPARAAHLFAPRRRCAGAPARLRAPPVPGRNYSFAAGLVPAYQVIETRDGETQVELTSTPARTHPRACCSTICCRSSPKSRSR